MPLAILLSRKIVPKKERLCQFTRPLVVLESATLPHQEVTLKREIRPDIDLIEESSTIDYDRFAV